MRKRFFRHRDLRGRPPKKTADLRLERREFFIDKSILPPKHESTKKRKSWKSRKCRKSRKSRKSPDKKNRDSINALEELDDKKK
ncbi:MAG: hypothetical protein WC139_09730 [Candidatus Kapaibacterium sp.]